MKRGAGFTVGVTCLALAAAGALHAGAAAQDQEIPKHDLRALCDVEASFPEPGETYTVEYAHERVAVMAATREDGTTRSRDQAESIESTFVVHFDDREVDGVALPVTVHVPAWTSTSADGDDTSLAGRTVVQTGADAWSVGDGDDGLSKMARTFISRELIDGWADADEQPLHDETTRSMFPDHPVAVGEEWDVSGAEFEKRFTDRLAGRVSLADTTGTGRLVAADVVDGEMVLEIEIALEGRVATLTIGRGAVVDAADGGEWSITLHVRGAPTRFGSDVQGFDFKLAAQGTSDSGASMTLQMEMHQRTAIQRGGDLPQPADEE